jgi:hypothetical protein
MKSCFACGKFCEHFILFFLDAVGLDLPVCPTLSPINTALAISVPVQSFYTGRSLGVDVNNFILF